MYMATKNGQDDSMAKWKCCLNFCENKMAKTPVIVYTAVVEDINSSNGPNSNSVRWAPSSSTRSITQPLTHNVNGKREPDILGTANSGNKNSGNAADLIAKMDKLLSEARKKAHVTLGKTSTISRSPKGKQGKTDDGFKYINPNHQTNHKRINHKNGNNSGNNNGPISRLRKFRKDCHSVKDMSRVQIVVQNLHKSVPVNGEITQLLRTFKKSEHLAFLTEPGLGRRYGVGHRISRSLPGTSNIFHFNNGEHVIHVAAS